MTKQVIKTVLTPIRTKYGGDCTGFN